MRNASGHQCNGCSACGKALQLSNCQDETSGLGSFLYIMCSDPECEEVNVCITNKSHRATGAGRGRPSQVGIFI